MRDAANIITANGGKLPVLPDETGKTIALDVPIGADVANIGEA